MTAERSSDAVGALGDRGQPVPTGSVNSGPPTGSARRRPYAGTSSSGPCRAGRGIGRGTGRHASGCTPRRPPDGRDLGAVGAKGREIDGHWRSIAVTGRSQPKEPLTWDNSRSEAGGDAGNRTRVQGFAGPCLSHSATSPGRPAGRAAAGHPSGRAGAASTDRFAAVRAVFDTCSTPTSSTTTSRRRHSDPCGNVTCTPATGAEPPDASRHDKPDQRATTGGSSGGEARSIQTATSTSPEPSGAAATDSDHRSPAPTPTPDDRCHSPPDVRTTESTTSPTRRPASSTTPACRPHA